MKTQEIWPFWFSEPNIMGIHFPTQAWGCKVLSLCPQVLPTCTEHVSALPTVFDGTPSLRLLVVFVLSRWVVFWIIYTVVSSGWIYGMR